MSSPAKPSLIHLPLNRDEHALLDKLKPEQLDEVRAAAADAAVAAAIRIWAAAGRD